MKKNITKLMVITTVTLASVFIMSTIVIADPPGPRSLRGQYAATGSQTCLLAQCGFLPNYVPRGASSGLGSINSFSLEGIFKIEPDGTGEVSITKRSINFPPTLPTIPSASAGVAVDTWQFTSSVAKDGSYTMEPDVNSYKSKWTIGPYVGSEFTMNGWVFNGNITPDGKTITLNTGVPIVATLYPQIIPQCPYNLYPPQLICNTSLVLIWQHDIDEE